MERYIIYISPPPWSPELSWQEYLPILKDTIRAERAQYHILAWDKARLPDGPDGEVDPAVDGRYRALQDHIRKGGDPDMPDETVPAIHPAPEIQRGDQQQQAIDLGFGTPANLPGRWTFKDTLWVKVVSVMRGFGFNITSMVRELLALCLRRPTYLITGSRVGSETR